MSSFNTVTDGEITQRLSRFKDPEKAGNIVENGRISGLVNRDGHIQLVLSLPSSLVAKGEDYRKEIEESVRSLTGIKSATVILTTHRDQQTRLPHAPRAARLALPKIRHIIAIASGKGGVGKSTAAINIALGLKTLGLRIGLMDADIYGPSQPRLLNLSGRPESHDGKTLEPMQAYGLKAMSMGFLIPEDTAMIWRGPMVMSAITQLLRDVAWGELDVLVIDLPPGTGDAQLTIAQQVPLSGAVIISTPQDIALIDAKKGINMFHKVEIPILGIIENMSYFTCPHCGERSEIFAHGGAKAEAERFNVPFLGEIPLALEIRETSDKGTPIVASNPQSPYAQSFIAIAKKIWQGLDKAKRNKPEIIIE